MSVYMRYAEGIYKAVAPNKPPTDSSGGQFEGNSM
jgi:hypothetical protein